MVTHTMSSCSAFNPSKVLTHSSEYTPRAVGSHLCCGAQEALVCVRCLAQGHLSHGIEGGESTVHSLPPPTIPAGPSNPLDYESYSLTIRPQLPWVNIEQKHDITLYNFYSHLRARSTACWEL